MLQGVKGLLGSGQVGLADIEMVYFHPVPLGGIGIGSELADRGGRNGFPAQGDFRHG